MASLCRRTGGAGGFTLIEVLVALVIGGLAVMAIAAVFGSGLLASRVSNQAVIALTLAETKLAAAGADEPLRPGDRGGSFDNHFGWRLSIARYEDPGRPVSSDVETPSALRLYRIAVTVAWNDGAKRRQLTLSTLRLGPAPP